MFIIWGTKTREEDGGIVADWCDTCRAPSYHKLTHYFKVGHIYYIPLGKGTPAGTNRQCTQCGTTHSCNPSVYSRPLTHEEAIGRSFEEILQTTNPTLAETLHKQRAFEQQVAERIAQSADPATLASAVTPIGGTADHRMLAALQTLGTLDARDKDVVQFMDRLQKWDYLTPSEREVLLHEISAFAAEDRKVNAALHFIKMLPTPTPNWISYLGCFGGLAILIGGFSTVPFLQSWLWGPLFVVGTTALLFFAYVKASDKAVRAWVEKTLVPQLRQRDVDVSYLVGLLASIKGNTGGVDEKIADMARNIDVIADELMSRGLLKLEAESALAPPAPSMPEVPVQPAAVESPHSYDLP